MKIKLVQLSRTDLKEALHQKYLLPAEDQFVTGVQETYKEYKKTNYFHWILFKNNRARHWLCGGIITYGLDVDENKKPCHWIQRLIVIPQYRRKGIAFKAVAIVLKEFLFSDLEIYTSIILGNFQSESLFRKIGFQPTNRKFDDDEIIWKYNKQASLLRSKYRLSSSNKSSVSSL